MLKMSKCTLPLMNVAFSWLPLRVRRPIARQQKLITDLLVHGGRKGYAKYALSMGIQGKWTQDAPDTGEDGSKLAGVLAKALLTMKAQQQGANIAYLPAVDWAAILDAEWSEPLANAAAGDLNAFESFLRNFFRNGGISGIWGNRGMFDEFTSGSTWEDLDRLALFVKQFEAWRRESPGCNLDELDAPRVGNPWGYNLDGRLVVEPAFGYLTLALQIRELVSNVAHPVILEIGGGFGGLARQLLRHVPGVRYIGVDLPENVIVQSWYLKRSLSDRFIAVNEVDRANLQDLGGADAVLLPNLALPELQMPRLDAIINVRSFGEMSRATLTAYFAEIVRLQPEWVFHENIATPRLDTLHGIPSNEYSRLEGYRLINSSESRWPQNDHRSAYPCREYLYRNNNIVNCVDAPMSSHGTSQ